MIDESVFKNNFIDFLNKTNTGWIDGDKEPGGNKKVDVVNHQLKIAIEIKDDSTDFPKGMVGVIDRKLINERLGDQIRSANNKFKEYPDYKTLCLFRTEFIPGALKDDIEGLETYSRGPIYLGKVGKYSKFAKNEVGGYLIIKNNQPYYFYFTNSFSKPERIIQKEDVEMLADWSIEELK